MVGEVHAQEQERKVFPARGKLLLISLLALCPALRVHRRLDVNQVALSRVEGHDIEFRLVTSLLTTADPHILFHEIAVVLVPLSYQVFKKVARHSIPRES